MAMSLPPWLHTEGAWIAIGVSLVLVVASWVMHRVVVKVLKTPANDPSPGPSVAEEHCPHE